MARKRRGSRGRLLAACVVVASAAGLASHSRDGAAASIPRPAPRGVVLISLDTLRADRLNAYGYARRPLSPQIDGLARDGVLFENHIAASPWTTPSHLSLFTSLHPTAHGVTLSSERLMSRLAKGEPVERLASSLPTLPKLLKRSGRDAAAFTGGITLDPRLGFGEGFDVYESSMFKMGEEAFARMEAWLRGRGGRPFFLFWHTFEVHAPYLNPAFLHEVLPPAKAKALAAETARLPSSHDSLRRQLALLQRQGADATVCRALYDGGVASADRWVGRLVASLREARLYDDALIVLTSDHGEDLGERAGAQPSAADGLAASYNRHGHTLYDDMLRVPLVLKLPQNRHAGRRVAAVTRAIDVLPTILDLLGERAEQARLQGRTLRPYWTGGAPALPAFSEALSVEHESKGLRSERYKYILPVDAATVARHGRAFLPSRTAGAELYDLARDPGETRNLLANGGSRDQRRIAEALDGQLRRASGERVGRPESAPLPADTVEKLRALGYIR